MAAGALRWVVVPESFGAFPWITQAQKICPEGEWETMMESFRTPLPTTFRINGSGKYALDIRDMLKKKYFKEISDLDGVAGEDGETLTAPFSLPW